MGLNCPSFAKEIAITSILSGNIVFRGCSGFGLIKSIGTNCFPDCFSNSVLKLTIDFSTVSE